MERKTYEYGFTGHRLHTHGPDLYEGHYVNDKRHGKGKFTYGNGDIYEGDFANDKRHGKGKMTFADGRVLEGNWIEDEFTDK
jgi:hypothetical protein